MGSLFRWDACEIGAVLSFEMTLIRLEEMPLSINVAKTKTDQKLTAHRYYQLLHCHNRSSDRSRPVPEDLAIISEACPG